jgi:hypothetical protein
MRRTDCKSKLGIKENKWDYIFVEVGSHSHIIVCLSFICDVLKITKNRLEVIKIKIIAKKVLPIKGVNISLDPIN